MSFSYPAASHTIAIGRQNTFALKLSRAINRVKVEFATNVSSVRSASIIRVDIDFAPENFNAFIRRESLISYIYLCFFVSTIINYE